MFNRKIIKELENWALRENRKPLILRGARQVGKTTLINKLIGDQMILKVSAERETTCFWRVNFSLKN